VPTGAATGFSYQWFLSGTPVLGATDSTYRAGISGIYSVSISGGTSCFKTSSGKAATINTKPIASFSASGTTTICSGGYVTLNAPSISGYNYTWLKDGVMAGTGNSKIFKLAGNYTVVAKQNGCTDTAHTTMPIVVNPLPVAGISALAAATFCAGDSCALGATPLGMSIYEWHNGSNVIATTDVATQKVGVSGTMKVMVTDTNGCVSKVSSTSVKTKMNLLPIATVNVVGSTSLSATGFVKLKSSPALADGYQWYKNGNVIAGATTSTYITSVGGSFVAGVTKLGCTGYSNTIVIAPTTPKENQGITSDASFELSAYPNPVSDVLTVTITGIEGAKGTIQMMDFNGRLVATQEMKQASTTINMGGYASGVYLVRFKDNEGRTGTVKVVKE
jgi:hypothetical protein